MMFRRTLRGLIRTPTTSIAVVLVLALGIGVNLAVFDFAFANLGQDVPGARDDGLARVLIRRPPTLIQPATVGSRLSYPEVLDLRDSVEAFGGLAAHASAMAGFRAGSAAQAELVRVSLVSANYFRVLGASMERGRDFFIDEDQAPNPVAILGYDLWLDHFAGDPAAVGGSLQLNGVDHTVIGIVAAEFRGTDRRFPIDLWVPLSMQPRVAPRSEEPLSGLELRDHRIFGAIGSLRAGHSFEQAALEISVVGKRIAEATVWPWMEDEESAIAPEWFLQSGAHAHMPPNTFLHRMVRLLGGFTLLLLGAAWAGAASLFLARGVSREPEFFVHSAVGANAWQQARPLLLDAGALVSAAGVLGWLLALAAGRLLSMSLPLTGNLPSLQTSSPAAVAALALVLTLLTVILCGLLPALRSIRNVRSFLARSSAGGLSAPKTALRSGLVVAQLALSTLLLIGTGLFAKSLGHLREFDLGFDAEPVTVARLDLGLSRASAEASDGFFGELRRRLMAMPGVEAAAFGVVSPFDSRSVCALMLRGVEPPPGQAFHVVDCNGVSPGYFETMGIPIVAGRSFSESDKPDEVLILSEEFVRRYGDGRQLLGRDDFAITAADGETTTRIVGVVADIHHYSVRDEPTPFLYKLHLGGTMSGRIVVRAAHERVPVTESIREAIAALDPNLGIASLYRFRDRIEDQRWMQNLLVRVGGITSVLTALVAGIGLYSLMAFVVGKRRREIGVRMALGANQARIQKLMLVRGVVLSMVGSFLGVALSIVAARMLGSTVEPLLFEVASTDPAIIAASIALLLALSLFASSVPVWRASKLQPADALRRD